VKKVNRFTWKPRRFRRLCCRTDARHGKVCVQAYA
jgi:hypothetical protein